MPKLKELWGLNEKEPTTIKWECKESAWHIVGIQEVFILFFSPWRQPSTFIYLFIFKIKFIF